MNAKAAIKEIDAEPTIDVTTIIEQHGDVISVEADKAKLLFQHPEVIEPFLEQLDKRIAAFPKMSVDSKKTRDQIRSTAVAIRDMKTGIDKAGADLADDMRKAVAKIDATRRTIKEQLEDRQHAVRKPLTDWEEAEKKRKADIQDTINKVRELGQVKFGETAAQIQQRIDDMPTHGEEFYAEFWDEAELVINTVFNGLVGAKTIAENDERERERLAEERRQFEADREKERLRQEAEQKARDEADAKRRQEQEAADAERRRVEEAEAAERKRIADAEEAERRRKIDEETARMAAERAALDAERERLAKEKAEADARAAAEQARKDEEARQDAERVAAEERAAADEERQATIRADITGDIASVIIDCKRDVSAVALRVADAIIAGQIRHVVAAS